MGRVPKATISLMYWKVRLESICGNGPESDGAGSVVATGAGWGAGTAAPAEAVSDVGEDDPLLQAILPSMNISRIRRKPNHWAHEGTLGQPVRKLVVGLCVFRGIMALPVVLYAPRS